MIVLRERRGPARRGALAMSPAVLFLLSSIAALLGSAAQSTVGFGTALVLSPLLLAVLEPAEAVFCTLAQATLLSVVMLARERRGLVLDRAVTLMLLLPAVPGVLAGATLVGVISGAWLQLAVGIIVLSFIAVRLRWAREPQVAASKSAAAPRPGRRRRDRALAPAAGFASGLLNGAVSTGGPPLAIWLHWARVRPEQIRHTLAVVFVVINLLTLLALLAVADPAITREGRAALLGAGAGVPLGYGLGAFVFGRLTEARFGALFATLLFVVGLASTIAGLRGL